MLAALLAVGCSTSEDRGATRSEGSDLPTRIDRGLDAALEREGTPLAIVVQLDGKRVYQRYTHTTPADYRDVASVTKSVLSTLVGIAVGEGRIRGVEATLAELLPTYADTMTPAVRRTTLRQVLTMTGGFIGEMSADGFAFIDARDPVRSILDTPVARPGRQFIYSSAGPHLLPAILEQATGMSVLDYARARLFDPLGIRTRPAQQAALTSDEDIDAYYATGFAWPVDRRGHALGYGRLKLRPDDMVKLGSLYLDQGRWKGEELVPATWVREATSGQVEVRGQGPAKSYGYGWWVDDSNGTHSFLAWGFGGQLIRVVPERGLVLVASQGFDLRDEDVNGAGEALRITDVVLTALDAP